MSQKIYSNLEIKGNVTVSNITNAILDTDKFLVSDGGLLKYRTGSEMLFDIGVTSGYVPYTGAISNLNLGEYQLSTGQITFDQTPTQAAGVGVLRWNDADGTLDLGLKGGNVTLQLGQEQLVRVVNKTLTNLTEAGYQVVYTSGAQGQRLKVDLALANSDLTSAGTLGIVTENIAVNQEGFVTTNGLVRGINTTGSLQSETWIDGDILYLSPTTAGMLTNIKPIAPDHTLTVGICVHAHATQGSIFIKVDNGYELEELHNVLITGVSNNDILVYESATTLWKNKSISTILGYTPANDNNVVHKTGDETIEGFKTFQNGQVIIYGGASNPLYIQANNVGAYIENLSANDALKIENTSSGDALNINGTTASTGKILKVTNNNVETLNITKEGNVTANSFIKSGGTSSQFLKADGSVDSSTYQTVGATHYIGTTLIANNRASATQTLTGISIDGNSVTSNRLVGYTDVTEENWSSLYDNSGSLRLLSVMNIPTASTGMANNYGTVLHIGGYIGHDKTQLIFNGGNGSIQYRKSWFNSTPWTSIRTLWDSANFTNLNQLTTRNYSDLQNKPTTLSGYGITDALLSSSYTASDVLTKVKTVDGSGSGLDADLLDGQHGSYYAGEDKLTGHSFRYVSTYNVPASMLESWFKISTANSDIVYLDIQSGYDNSISKEQAVVTLFGYNMKHHISSTTSNYNASKLLELKTNNNGSAGSTEIWARFSASTSTGYITIKSSHPIPTLVPEIPTFSGGGIVSLLYTSANRINSSLLITRGINIDNNLVWHAGNLANPITGTGTTNYLPKFTGTSTLGNSLIFDNGTNVGIGTTSPTEKLEVVGTIKSTSSVQVGDNSLAASSTNVGAIRYRSGANNSYMDMVMQTGASTYEWVNVVKNTWT